MKILIFAAIALLMGVYLAISAIHFDVSTGWAGALILLGWSIWARKKWSIQDDLEGSEPSVPEQIIWLRTLGVGILAGHLATILLHPQIDLHLGSSNSLAQDSWVLTGALVIAALLFRYHPRERDERFDIIAARGIRAGYTCLIISLSSLLLFLGFAPQAWQDPLTHWVLGNLLVALLLLAYFVQLIAQLFLYRPRHD